MSQKRTMNELNRLSVKDFVRSDKLPVWVILENIRSGLNVGSIFRSADAFRVAHVACVGYTPSPPHREVLKTALGATESVAWSAHKDIHECINFFEGEKLEWWAVEQVHGSIPLHSFPWNSETKVAFVFGNEVSGVSQECISLCAGSVEIVQFGTKHSLNVAVSAGIVLHTSAGGIGLKISEAVR